MPRVYSDIVEQGHALRPRLRDLPGVLPLALGDAHRPVGASTRASMATASPSNGPRCRWRLHDAGYRTMLAGKYLNSWIELRAPGPNSTEWSCVGTPGSLHVHADRSRGSTWTALSSTSRAIRPTSSPTRSWTSCPTTPQDQPFFALYAPTTPHSPADDPAATPPCPVTVPHPPSYDAETRTPADARLCTSIPARSRARSAASTASIRSTARSVRALDDAVGTLLDGLGDRADDTLVIYVSDNGYMFGEHRRVGKFDAYEEAVHVPMAIRYPAVAHPADRVGRPICSRPTSTWRRPSPRLAGIPWQADGVVAPPALMGSPAGSAIHDAVLIERCQGDPHAERSPATAFTYRERCGLSTGVRRDRHGHCTSTSSTPTVPVQLFDLAADPSEMVEPRGAARRRRRSRRRLAGPAARDCEQTRRPPDTTIVDRAGGPR